MLNKSFFLEQGRWYPFTEEIVQKVPEDRLCVVLYHEKKLIALTSKKDLSKYAALATHFLLVPNARVKRENGIKQMEIW